MLYFFFYKCANKTDVVSFKAQSESGIPQARDRESLRIGLLKLRYSSTLFCLSFQVKCSLAKTHSSRSLAFLPLKTTTVQYIREEKCVWDFLSKKENPAPTILPRKRLDCLGECVGL